MGVFMKIYGIINSRMKKLIFLFFLFAEFEGFALTKKQCLNDFNELKNHLIIDSISYENIQKSGMFDYEKVFSNIKNQILAEETDDISQKVFFDIIYNNLRGIPDHHIALWFNNEYFDLGLHETFFFSSEKGGIRLPTLSKDGKKYIKGIYKKQSVFKNEQSDDFYKFFKEIDISSPSIFNFIKSHNQAYIRIPNFNEEHNRIELERFVDFGKESSKMDIVVIDLTENQGGNISYFSRFLCAFSDIDYEDDFDNNFATDYIFTRNILRKKIIPYLLN